MFRRFSDRSRLVLVEAHDIAVEFGSPWIDTGHLLYGCATIDDPTTSEPMRRYGLSATRIRQSLARVSGAGAPQVDPQSLRTIGIDYDSVKAAIEDTFGAGALDSAPDRRAVSGSARPRFTPAAKRALELALGAAVEFSHDRMEPGHLLLGSLRSKDAFVADVVQGAGATPDQLATAVIARLSPAQDRPA